MRVFLLGATGTIGRATAQALIARGHDVVCFVRGQADLPAGVTIRLGQVTDPVSLAQDGFAGERFDAIVSCLASRTGTPATAWAIDHRAHVDALRLGQAAGITQFVLLSAICVQKPTLAFQQAKLAFESDLTNAGVTYSIVRATAFFKSLSGQVARVKKGKPFLIFGDGLQTACKPISDADLGAYLADCLTNPTRHNRILPIGGPGPAITPMDQGAELFRQLNMPAKYRSVPIRFLDRIIAVLDIAGRVLPRLKNKAELARIGRYYATESMLLWDPIANRYDAESTPSIGQDTLSDHYARLLCGDVATDLGDHAVF
jgi:divinyl chlorophyllide a 8-vinyl-reductase